MSRNPVYKHCLIIYERLVHFNIVVMCENLTDKMRTLLVYWFINRFVFTQLKNWTFHAFRILHMLRITINCNFAMQIVQG